VPDYSGFEISRHAMRRMFQRGISLDQLQKAMDFPDRREIDDDDPELVHVLKRFHHKGGSRILRVVYNSHRTPPRIVTVFFEKK
jgi:Domain of unknown function (DUF4258)